MHGTSNYFVEYLKEMKRAVEKRDFVAMSEIYNEMLRLKNENMESKIILFTEVDENNRINIPCVIPRLLGKERTGAFIYNESKCVEICYECIELETWQKEFVKNDVSAVYEELEIRHKQVILTDAICHELNIRKGDIIKLEICDEIVLNKFQINE